MHISTELVFFRNTFIQIDSISADSKSVFLCQVTVFRIQHPTHPPVPIFLSLLMNVYPSTLNKPLSVTSLKWVSVIQKM